MDHVTFWDQLQLVHELRDSEYHGKGVNLDLIHGHDDQTTFFADGVRKIDFVLVYEERIGSDVGLAMVEEQPGAEQEEQKKARYLV